MVQSAIVDSTNSDELVDKEKDELDQDEDDEEKGSDEDNSNMVLHVSSVNDNTMDRMEGLQEKVSRKQRQKRMTLSTCPKTS